jgi:hypothetical protein
MNPQEQELRLTIPDQHLPCLISFLDVFQGLPFYFEKYSLESLSCIIQLFKLSSLSQFISENLPSPQNIQEVLEFLSNHSWEFYPSIFDESIAILIQQFSEIRIDQFLKLSNFVLEKLLQSPQLRLDNEDTLFSLVVELIGRDPNRKVLLKLIYFPGVSTAHLIQFFNNFPVEEIDSDLFDSLKTRLFCDILLPNSIPSSRWQNLPTFRSKEEIDQIFQILQDHFNNPSNQVELIKTLIKENKEMKNQLQNVGKEKEELKKENVQLKNQLQNVQNEKEETKRENAQLKNQNEKLTQSVRQQNKEIENLKHL